MMILIVTLIIGLAILAVVVQIKEPWEVTCLITDEPCRNIDLDCTNCFVSKGVINLYQLSFHEWLFEYHNFDKNDIENLLSSDELSELHEEYEEWLSQQ